MALCFSACTRPASEGAEQGGRVQRARAALAESGVGFYAGYVDSSGGLWFATRGRGVFHFDGQGFTHYTTEDGLSSNNVTCIAEDDAGNMWFGMPDGACRYNGRVFSHLTLPWSDTSSIWLDEVYPVVNPNQVMSIHEDRTGALWFGTNGAGAYRYEAGQFSQHLADVGMVYDDGQHHNIVLSMDRDREGNLWFASLSHAGVSRFDGTAFAHFTTELSDDFVRVVYGDPLGKVWVGTHGNHKGGLDVFDGTGFKAFHKTDDGFRHNNIWDILMDHKGTYWMASGTTALSLFDGAHFRPFEDQNGKQYNEVLFVVEDAEKRIWFGGPRGLWRWDGAQVESMSKS